MGELINIYSPMEDLPEPPFPHQLTGRRSISDPELAKHLAGFAGYVASRGSGGTSVAKRAVIEHIGRTRHQLAMFVEKEQFESLAEWAWAANALLFTQDGAVRDPGLFLLVGSDGSGPDKDAHLPYPKYG